MSQSISAFNLIHTLVAILEMKFQALLIFFLSNVSTIAFSYQHAHYNSYYATKVLYPKPHLSQHVLQQTVVDEQSGIFRRKNIPIFGVAVGLTALCFQVMVLYPWHERLRDDFSTLEVDD